MTVELPKNCAVCASDKRFIIQKAIDNGTIVADDFGITVKDIHQHNQLNHRETLIAFGVMDYTVRKHAIDVGETLASFIEKWETGFKNRTPDKIKDGDALKAMEMYAKLSGKLTDKHEVTIKRSIEDALQDFLSE